MATSYLVDTSVLRGASSAALDAIATLTELVVSPYSVWELLSHLDASEFDRVKGNLMKVRYVRILEAPRPALEKLVCAPSDPVHDHVLDSDLAYAMLAALRRSCSLRDFYRMQIRDERGDVRQIDGCVDRLRDILATDEQRFAALMSGIVSGIQTAQISMATSADRHAAALSVLFGLWQQLGDRVAGPKPTEAFIRAAYVHAGYLVHRAIELSQGRARDPNDFEDSEISLHLPIGSGWSLVTADKSFRRVVADSLRTWKEVRGEDGGIDVRGVDALGA